MDSTQQHQQHPQQLTPSNLFPQEGNEITEDLDDVLRDNPFPTSFTLDSLSLIGSRSPLGTSLELSTTTPTNISKLSASMDLMETLTSSAMAQDIIRQTFSAMLRCNPSLIEQNADAVSAVLRPLSFEQIIQVKRLCRGISSRIDEMLQM
jgi:hypothetical protein